MDNKVQNVIKYAEGALDTLAPEAAVTRLLLTRIVGMLKEIKPTPVNPTEKPIVFMDHKFIPHAGDINPRATMPPLPLPLATPKKVPGPTHPPKPQEQLPKPWSSQYPQCRDCGTTKKNHMGRGYCTSCYFKNPSDQQQAKQPQPRPDYIPEPGSYQDKINKSREKEAEHIRNIEYGYCANPSCGKGNFGKFVKGTGTDRDNLEFCSLNCADEIRPKIDIKPLPENTNGEIAQKTRNL